MTRRRLRKKILYIKNFNCFYKYNKSSIFPSVYCFYKLRLTENIIIKYHFFVIYIYIYIMYNYVFVYKREIFVLICILLNIEFRSKCVNNDNTK